MAGLASTLSTGISTASGRVFSALGGAWRGLRSFARNLKFGSAKAIGFIVGLIAAIPVLWVIMKLLYNNALKPLAEKFVEVSSNAAYRIDMLTTNVPMVHNVIYAIKLLAKAFYEYVIMFVAWVVKNIVPISRLLLGILIFTSIEYYINEYVKVSTSATYALVQTYNYGGRVTNFTLDGANSYVLPIYNGVTRANMLVIEHTYNGIKNNEPVGNTGGDLTSGRQLQGPPETEDELIFRILAWIYEIYNEYVLLLIDLFFDVLYIPFRAIMQSLAFVAGRFSCMMAGRTCTLREISQAVINLLIDGINAIFGFFGRIPRVTSIACNLEQLEGVNCDTCKGTFFSLAAGMFEALLECVASRRALMIDCRELADGSFVEKIDNEVVHVARTEFKSCPHTKDMFSGFGNARNNFKFNTREYHAMFHGIDFHSTYYDGLHIITTKTNMTDRVVRRRMGKIDISRVVNWNQPRERRDTRSAFTTSKTLSREAKADLIKAHYTDNHGNCQFGTSWSDIFHLSADFACLFETLSGNKVVNHIETLMPEKSTPLFVDRISHHANRMLLLSDAVNEHPSRFLSEVMEDLTPKHQVRPFYGMYMHMKRNRNKTYHEQTRRRARRELTIIDYCSPQLTCANNQQCVDDLKDCDEPVVWDISTYLTYTGQQAGTSMQDTSFENTVLDIRSCLQLWKDHPSTDPYSYDVIVGGRTEGVVYCGPMVEYTDWRPQLWTFDLANDINTWCTSATVFNGCNCSTLYFDPPKNAVQDGVFFSLNAQYAVFNGFIWIRQVLVSIGFSFAWFAITWGSVFAGTSAPLAMQYFFLGTNGGMTDAEVWACWVFHTGDFFILYLIIWVIIFYISATVKVYLYEEYKNYVYESKFRRYLNDIRDKLDKQRDVIDQLKQKEV